MRIHRLFGALALWLASATLAVADNAAFTAAAEPGAIVIMRHALAPGTGDPGNFRLNDCSTQRNLNDAGRAQSEAIGQAFRDAGILFDRVMTSQWCRCRETAKLLGHAPPEDLPALNSFFQDRSTRDQQTADVKRSIDAAPKDQRIMLVTHQVNITALIGGWVSSGEAIVLRRKPEGGFEISGRILIDP